jgi:hypothetical protein
MSNLELAFVSLAVLLLLVSALAELVFFRTAATADEDKLRVMERTGRALISVARLGGLATIVLTATFIITSTN